MIAYPAHLSAFRNLRAKNDRPLLPSVSSPVSATTSTTRADMNAAAQAAALRNASEKDEEDREGPWGALGKDDQTRLLGAYGQGGFQAVAKLPNWYELPSHIRTQLLARLSGGV